MGARIDVRNLREVCGEAVADITVEHAALRPTVIGPDLALRAIDEIPLLAVAAAFAPGSTRIEGVGALRFKESDRVAAIEQLLSVVGVQVELQRNALTIRGGRAGSRGDVVTTHDDHRIAMAAAVLACAAGPISIDGGASLDVSFPSFLTTLDAVRA